MVALEYWNGGEWVDAGGPWQNEALAWVTLGQDCENYRTRNVETNEVLTDKRAKL